MTKKQFLLFLLFFVLLDTITTTYGLNHGLQEHNTLVRHVQEHNPETLFPTLISVKTIMVFVLNEISEHVNKHKKHLIKFKNTTLNVLITLSVITVLNNLVLILFFAN